MAEKSVPAVPVDQVGIPDNHCAVVFELYRELNCFFEDERGAVGVAIYRRRNPHTGPVPEISHDELVREAFRWLKYVKTCTVVFMERIGSTMENPDAIGFHTGGHSVLIECKASRSDFQADKKKWFRQQPEMGMGQLRYIMAPIGLIKSDELPENWGLLEVGEKARKYRQIYETVAPKPFAERYEQAEISYLVSAIRRIEISMAVFVEREDAQ
jgi:hypothetical protein